jgi:hypothetical protein
MRSMVWMAAALLGPCASSVAAADCAVTATDLKPQFAAKLPRGFRLSSSKLDKKKRTFTQALKLPDDVVVTMELGGCERLTYSYFIKAPTITTRTVGAEVLAVSRRVLPMLPMRDDAIADPKRLIKALEDAQIVSLPSTIPCGDATCKLSIEPDPNAKPETKATPKPKAKGRDDEKDEQRAEESKAAEVPGLIHLSYEGPTL